MLKQTKSFPANFKINQGAISTQRGFLTSLFSAIVPSIRTPLRMGRPIPTPDTTAQKGILLSSPFFHITGCGNMVRSTFAGMKIVMMYKWDAGKALQLIEKERITQAGGVPSMVFNVRQTMCRSVCCHLYKLIMMIIYHLDSRSS